MSDSGRQIEPLDFNEIELLLEALDVLRDYIKTDPCQACNVVMSEVVPNELSGAKDASELSSKLKNVIGKKLEDLKTRQEIKRERITLLAAKLINRKVVKAATSLLNSNEEKKE